MQSQILHENWKFHQIGDESWFNAQVPGSVHLDLFNAGRIPDPFIGEILIVPYNFAPRGYAFCDGQLLPIAQHTALFSLLGTTYGGDGRTTFGLPDLRGRFPLGEGQGPGLTPRVLGESGGIEIDIVQGRPPILGWGSTNEIGKNTSGGNTISTPHPFIPPYLTLNFVIALQGIFPSRS